MFERKADLWAAGNRKKKTNTSHQTARVRFHPGNGFLCLSPVLIDSCLSSPDIIHYPDIPNHHLDELLPFNRRMFTSRYGEKQSGKQREQSDSERWQSRQVAVCVSAECGLRSKAAVKDPPPYQRRGPPVRRSPPELGGGGGPAKFPAAAPRCPSRDAPGDDPSV